MSGKYGRDLPAAVRAEISKMVLAISRKQFTQEQAMQEIAYYCLERDGYYAAPSDTAQEDK